MPWKERKENKDLRDLILDNLGRIRSMYIGPNGHPINIDFMSSIREDSAYVELFVEGQCVAGEQTLLPDEFDFVDVERELLLKFIKSHMIFPAINYLIRRELPLKNFSMIEKPLTEEESYES